MEYSKLFSPIKIGNTEIKNRICMAPMLMDFGQFDGRTTEQLMNYYEERAKGGTGLIITEITRVNDRTGGSAFAQLGMSHDYQIEGMRELANRIHAHGSKLFVQLHHPGRQNMGLLIGTLPLSIACEKAVPHFKDMLYKVVPAGKILMKHHLVPRVVAPSKCENSYFSDGNNRALRKSEIKGLIADFIAAAVRVKKSGCDGVQLHASHGYLLQQFLSPNTNKRTDEYGGSLENRMRFILEIIEGIKNECGKDFPVIVRLTVDECYERIGQKGKGYDLAEGVKMAQMLEKAGVDAIDVSSAAYDTFNFWLEPTSFECGWRKHMAAAVKNAVSIPVIAANLIRSPEQAELQLEEGIQDMISLGRPHIADPHWAKKAESGHPEDIKRCICCLYCIESMQNNAYIGDHGYCAVNPFVGNEDYQPEQNGNGRKILVAGSGPAGLTAAELLAKRGFSVTVMEKSDKLGGQVDLAVKPPHKDKLYWCIEDLHTACRKLGVEILLNAEVTKATVEQMKPYALILATGAYAVKPEFIKGHDKKQVYTTTDILNGSVVLRNQRVAVIGSGMTGLETAELLTTTDNKVSVVEMADEIAPGVWMQHVNDIMPRLNEKGTEFYASHKLTEIKDNTIVLQNKKGGIVELEADSVVLSLGAKSDNRLFAELKETTKNLFIIGDGEKVGRIADATRSAFECVKKIR
ncbi:MAG: FAD-dependent oxidoreductase [Clostridia bacterium]|nr:FAD-dependent oxidoreductase [Clostridia bacterium]